MSLMSHFDEKSGIISFPTEWGQWWQNIDEIHIEITELTNIKSKDVSVIITSNSIKCVIRGTVILEGDLFRNVHADEAVWTIEDQGTLLNIVLPKADYTKQEIIWEALLADNRYQPDPVTLREMRKKLDLEFFQIENPGFDFSSAKLA